MSSTEEYEYDLVGMSVATGQLGGIVLEEVGGYGGEARGGANNAVGHDDGQHDGSDQDDDVRRRLESEVQAFRRRAVRFAPPEDPEGLDHVVMLRWEGKERKQFGGDGGRGGGGEEQGSVLARLNNTSFALALGLCSNAVLLRALDNIGLPTASGFATLPAGLATFGWVVGFLALAAVALLYAAKVIVSPSTVSREFRNPARINLFFAPMLASVLLAIAAPDDTRSGPVMVGMWMLAAAYQLVFYMVLVHRWIYTATARNVHMLNLMSVVGFFLLTTFGSTMPRDEAVSMRPALEFTMVAGSIALVVTFLQLFMNPFEIGAEEKSSPIIFLFLAPPSAAAIAARSLSDLYQTAESGAAAAGEAAGVHWVFRIYFYFAILCFFWVIPGAGAFFKTKTFKVSFWAYHFPVTAFATAFLTYAARETPTTIVRLLAALACALSFVTLFAILARTIYHVFVTLCGSSAPPSSSSARSAIKDLAAYGESERPIDSSVPRKARKVRVHRRRRVRRVERARPLEGGRHGRGEEGKLKESLETESVETGETGSL
ncbi:uncharacterized protein AMSG_06523 [Thecamonas trahens ATCC 50062]|uniref:C4-dicarboxylate transporter/malic acid transporter n=1 Tax=Thecamonas trahens ATCC 50062 TaxID=461836 RepID=A0A0L0DFR8_THETB|nr:hypothetical protein AMSG_06523 [Thecamonas trahens ATCC 50062]KNC51172.1 hypothetical protein AMSG_06523 [Thecamonas trahens ATCC 50062]|eukprot:XP_013756374.1 hypothetical protein AMSG_06523 [Thecamonas trahens ATCC 50062]